jgi:membrane protein involved in D-alanine export
MTLFGDFPFFCWLAVLAVPAVILGILEKPIRYYTLFASLAFIFLAIGNDPKQLAFLGAFCFIELHLIKGYLYLRKKFGRNPVIYGHAVLFSILPLIVSKLAGIWGGDWFCFLGVSYLTFRGVQIIIESYDGMITSMGTLDFLGFLLFFPSLSSGPIDRSRRFLQDWNRVMPRREYLNLAGNGLMKILLGAVYKFVLAGIFYQIMGYFSESTALRAAFGYMYSYGFYLFFDFAGYSLMAVGASYLFGICTPENFRRPFVSRDIKEFWERWHITLSHWFRDFVFSRFLMNCIKKKRFSTRLSAACAAFFVNMLIMGAWHGLTGYYLLYGLYHGGLLAATECYQKKSKFYAKNKGKTWYQIVSWAVTFQLVMLGFFLFSGRLTQLIGTWVQPLLAV